MGLDIRLFKNLQQEYFTEEQFKQNFGRSHFDDEYSFQAWNPELEDFIAPLIPEMVYVAEKEAEYMHIGSYSSFYSWKKDLRAFIDTIDLSTEDENVFSKFVNYDHGEGVFAQEACALFADVFQRYRDDALIWTARTYTEDFRIDYFINTYDKFLNFFDQAKYDGAVEYC